MKIYLKPKNEIFARHLLSSCRQEASQNLNHSLKKLKLSAKGCGFKSVTARRNQNEVICDAFIREAQSNYI